DAAAAAAARRIRDAGRSRGRAQEGRPAQGPPRHAVLEALASRRRVLRPGWGRTARSPQRSGSRPPCRRRGQRDFAADGRNPSRRRDGGDARRGRVSWTSLGGSSSGRTSDSDSENPGSNPGPPATPRAAGRKPAVPLSADPDLAHAVLLADEEHVGAAMGKDPDGDDTRYLVETGFDLERIRDLEVMDIEDDVAVVRDEIPAPDWLAPRVDQLPGHERSGHRYDLDRQREGPERSDELRRIDDADEAPRRAREHLLARQCAAAALQQVQMLRCLVGAVDIKID